MVLIVTGSSMMLSVQAASQGAGQMRPVTSGKLLVEWRFCARLGPVGLVDEIVPVGDLVVHRAAGMAIGDAAIHAAGGLARDLRVARRDHELLEMAHAIGGRLVARS